MHYLFIKARVGYGALEGLIHLCSWQNFKKCYNFGMEITTLEIFVRLFMAASLGMLLGFERTVAGKRAGMRTFALVSLSSALFIITSILVNNSFLGRVNFDPMRTMAAIISGIGFIGAGLILFRENALRGLTTAAGLWVAAGVGGAVAFGLYYPAIFTTLLTLLIFTGVWFLEVSIKKIAKEDTPTIVEKIKAKKPKK